MGFLASDSYLGSGSVEKLFGDLVRFEDKTCSVFPDLDNVGGPPPGSRDSARAELDGRSFACQKGHPGTGRGQKPPSDGQTPEEVEGMKDTEFESFDTRGGQ